MAIVKKAGDSISLLNLEIKKKMAESIDSEVYLLIRKRTIFKDQSSLARLRRAPFSYPITDVVHGTI